MEVIINVFKAAFTVEYMTIGGLSLLGSIALHWTLGLLFRTPKPPPAPSLLASKILEALSNHKLWKFYSNASQYGAIEMVAGKPLLLTIYYGWVMVMANAINISGELTKHELNLIQASAKEVARLLTDDNAKKTKEMTDKVTDTVITTITKLTSA